MTSLNVTLNNLVQEVNDIASSHLMLNDFRYGDFLEIYQRGNMEYFALLMNIKNGNVDVHYVTLKLELMVLDKVFNDNSNLNDVESDALQIIQDIYSIITHSNRWQKFSKLSSPSVPIRKYLEKSKDKASGWSIEFSLKIKRQNGICDLPMSGYDFEGVYTPSCAGVRIIEDGLFKELIASGGEFSYVTGGSPVTTDFNNIPTGVTTPAGGQLDIDVVNESLSQIGVLNINTNNNKRIEVSNSEVSNSDGTYLVEVEAEQPLVLPDIIHTQTNGSPDTLPAQIPLICGSPDVYYNRPFIQQTISYVNYDSAYRVANGANDYRNNIPNNALIQQISPDTVNGRVDYLKYFNIWGHKFRFTGETGGYYDEADGLYYNVDGILSTRADEFPTYSATRALIVDHLTGFMVASDRLGSQTWTGSMSDSVARTDGGYSDWLTVSMEEGLLLVRGDLTLFLGATDRSPFNYSLNVLWLGDTRLNSTTVAMRLVGLQYVPISSGAKTNTAAQRFYFREALTGIIPQ